MPTHSRKRSDATQIAEKILKEAAEPRLSASVKKALEKKVGKTKAAKASVSR